MPCGSEGKEENKSNPRSSRNGEPSWRDTSSEALFSDRITFASSSTAWLAIRNDG